MLISIENKTFTLTSSPPSSTIVVIIRLQGEPMVMTLLSPLMSASAAPNFCVPRSKKGAGRRRKGCLGGVEYRPTRRENNDDKNEEIST